MSTVQTQSKPRVRLEAVSIAHVDDFHKLWSSDKVALYSQRVVSDDIEENRAFFRRRFLDGPADKPWIVRRAIMVPKEGVRPVEEEAAGFISAAQPSPHGLMLAYQLRHECWGRGYASEAVRQFLDEYWGTLKMAPLSEIYAGHGPGGRPADGRDKTAGVAEADDGLLVEIRHLVGEVDMDNKASMRVMEKCGGRIVEVVEAELLRFEGVRPHAVWQMDKPERGNC